MTTRIIVGLIIILGLGIGGYALLKNKPAQTPDKSDATETAWIEISAGPIFNKTTTPAVELKSGDLLVAGSVIGTGATAHGNIHFPDGSVLRLDKKTTITISQIQFKKDDKSVIVKISLAVGRVWSKVVGLTTPESKWEVKTSNTVATVRGTAFGVSFQNGLSWVLGSENTVAVAPVNPATGEPIITSEILVGTNQFVQVTDQDVFKAEATTTSVLQTTSASTSLLNDPWVLGSKEEDKNFTPEPNNPNQNTGPTTQTENTTTAPKNTTTETTNTPTTSSNPTNTQGELIVTTNMDLTSVPEGETIPFQATLKTLSGSQDVTSKVTWSVIGQIGAVSNSGLFTAQLGSNFAELGEAVGYVVASIGNSNQVSKSPLIKVVFNTNNPTTNFGGQ